MKNNRLLRLVLVVVLLLAASALAVNEARKHMNLGLDLQGGIYVLYQAVDAGDGQDTDKVDRAITIIRNRIDSLGVVETVIQKEGNDRIRIELPGVEDQRQAREVIGQTAMLTFLAPDGSVILTGDDLQDAQPTFDQYNQVVVSLEFGAEGTRKFAEATAMYVGQIIAIELDGEVISAPRVENIISEGRAQISGSMGFEEAANLALMLRSGALPVELIELETRSIEPELGQDSLMRSVRAGIAGLILVLLFMVIYYRALGVVSAIALVTYLALLFGMLVGMNATMTLFGIAGFILSVGMAVDANVIIFERIKEELVNGRTMRTSIEAGFERAFRAILDANVTTLIAAAVLFQFAQGPVRGFAVTLSVGILASMITAILLTRFLLRQAVRAELLKTPAYAGIKSKQSSMSFVGLRKYAFIISALLIISGLVSMGISQANTGQILNLGIDFTSGTLMHLDIDQEFTLEEVREILTPFELEGAAIQRVGVEGLGEGEKHELLIKSRTLTLDEQDDVFTAFSERYDLTSSAMLRVENVNPIVGQELVRQAMLALLIAMVGMVLYITLRFEYRFALTAIAALLHDGLLVLAFFSIFRLEVNGPFIAAILMTLGYSINDTIVIYDRIRENMKNRHKEKLGEVVDLSIRQSLRRSIITSATTLLVLLTLFAFGGVTLRPFIAALLVGVLFGTYSSIFIASPLWLSWKERELKKVMKSKTA
jgi:SecD/SecF fusion protein